MYKAYYALQQRFGKQLLARKPEMDQVMYDHEQDRQYTLGGEVGALAIVYELIINTVRKISPERGRALDICCGSGQLLSLLASTLPEMSFTGVDLSPRMLHFARLQKEKLRVENLSFSEGNMFRLGESVSGKFDLITWNLALHHCETEEDVRVVLDQIAALLAPGGTVFIFDINRPKTGEIAVFLADYYNQGQGDWFYHDSLDSYKAAFSYEELGEILAASALKDAKHVQPFVGNCFQVIFKSSTRRKGVKPLRHLRTWWQKSEYAALRTLFRGLP